MINNNTIRNFGIQIRWFRENFHSKINFYHSTHTDSIQQQANKPNAKQATKKESFNDFSNQNVCIRFGNAVANGDKFIAIEIYSEFDGTFLILSDFKECFIVIVDWEVV